jgi:multiple sugar transport system substrate-binding protein
MRRRMILWGTAALLAAAAHGLPADAQQQPTIRYIGPTGGAVKAIVENLIPEFQKRTGIKIEASFVAHEALTQKAMTEFVAGSPSFDVIQFETSWGGRYAPFLENLEPDVKKAGDAYQADDILRAARRMGVYENKTVGLPYRVIGRMLHYRKDLFEQAGLTKPPETMAELLDYAKKLTKDTNGDGKPEVYGLGILGKQGYGNAYEFGTFLFSGGGAWWDLASCKVAFDDEAGVKALQFYADLLKKEGVVPPEVTTWAWDEWIAGGQKGRYAMSIMHTPYAVPLNDPKASETAGKWAWADAPGWTSVRDPGPPVGGWLLGIAAGAKNKDLAWKFVEFVTGPEGQLISASNANAPTRGSVFRNPQVQAMWPWAEVALRSLERGTPMYNNPEQMEAESALMVRVSEALIGAKPANQAASEGAAQLRTILQDSGRCK